LTIMRGPIAVIVPLIAAACLAQAQPVYVVPDGVETRWAGPENPPAAKGVVAQENGGRKGRSNIPVKAGEAVTLAEVRRFIVG